MDSDQLAANSVTYASGAVDQHEPRSTKPLEDHVFIKQALLKIKELEDKLEHAKAKGASQTEKKKLRNYKTSLQSKIKDRKLNMHFNELVDENSQKCELMCKILVDELKVYPQIMKTIIKKIKKSKIVQSQKTSVTKKKDLNQCESFSTDIKQVKN